MTSAAFGQALAAAVGIAISPVSIATVILLLLTPRARALSVGFLLGWTLGIAGALTAFTLFAGWVPVGVPGTARTVLAAGRLVTGALLLVAAGVVWWRGSRRAATDHLPGWVRALDRAAPAATFAAGLVMALNPPNLLLALAGGVAMGSTSPAVAAAAVGAVTLVAASTVLLPVLAHLAAPTRLNRPLAALRVWLLRHDAVIVVAVLGAVGVLTLAQGAVQITAG